MSDYAKVLTDLWSAQGDMMLRAQEQATRAMTEGMQALVSGKMPGLPSLSTDSADLSKAADATMKLWSAATATSADLASKLTKFGRSDGDGTMAAVFGRITDARQWLVGPSDMDEALARMAEGPRLADLFDLERRYAKVGQAWLQMRRRAVEHNAVVLEAWTKAGQRFAEEMSNRATAEGGTLDSKQIMALWTEVANHQLLETQRSEPYLKTQRDMIRATTDLRIAQQELVEHLGKQYGLPTRTELDDLHRSVTEMRRELRKLRRAAQAPASAERAAAAPESGPTAAPQIEPVAAQAEPAKMKLKRRKGPQDADVNH